MACAKAKIVTGPWLSPRAAAGYLGLTLRALYQAVRRGQLPAHRLGRRLRFSQPELDETLSSSTGGFCS
jgi:excisionase family DNA binding protein